MKKKYPKEYLKSFLKEAPLSHALWRSIEALSFEKISFKSPVLDLGCGFGEFAGVVFDKIEMGVDVNAHDLERALKGKRYNKVQWADARNLPFKKNSFQTATSVSVLEHIENAQEVLIETARVLKRGGLFVFSVPTTDIKKHLLIPSILRKLKLNNFAEQYYTLHCRAFKHVHLKTKKWWEEKLVEAGFEIIENHGTLSPFALKLHEIFLITAFPYQLGKLLFGKRFVMAVDLRSKLLPMFFTRFVTTDKNSDINIFFVAKKK
ncbi:MAG: class I SAM-dependent methyltransferase [Candidatus Woesearchaeota archaeon]|jgi:ubiquinone/menaquinone biosynthesis C-methylase UbiE